MVEHKQTVRKGTEEQNYHMYMFGNLRMVMSKVLRARAMFGKNGEVISVQAGK